MALANRCLNVALILPSIVVHKKHATHLPVPLRRPERAEDSPKIQTLPPPPQQPINSKINPKVPNPTTEFNSKCSVSDILRLLDSLSLPLEADVYVPLIKECTVSGDSDEALRLLGHMSTSGTRPTLPLINRLLIMTVSCRQLDAACQLFDKMRTKDFYSWVIMIFAFLDEEEYHGAIILFGRMLQTQEGKLDLPSWILCCLLKACALTRNLGLGKELHALLLKLGDINSRVSLSSALTYFYGRLGCFDDANLVFDQLEGRNTLVWTTKIVNGCRGGQTNEVLNDFGEMGRSGVKRNAYTFSIALKVCAKMNNECKCGQQVHASAIKLGLVLNTFVKCGLVDMYGKCGLLRDARSVFDAISEKRNTACWNAMLMGYVQNEDYVEAIKLLHQMDAAGIEAREPYLKSKYRAEMANAQR